MGQLHYRKATHADLQQLKELAIVSYSQYKPQLTEENWLHMLDYISADETYSQLLEQAVAFACFDNEKAVGVAYLVPQGNPTPVFDKSWSYIRMVSVHPDYGGMGIAKHLTGMCIEHAKLTGEKTLALHTSEMMDAARHIYEKAGFRQVRELELHYGKRYWLYILEL